jgi:hypothetical protein
MKLERKETRDATVRLSRHELVMLNNANGRKNWGGRSITRGSGQHH